MRIFFIGDVVGRPGRTALEKELTDIKNKYAIDFTIINGENSAGGLGITPEIMNFLFDIGIDVITSGNHIWKKREIFESLDEPRLLRPHNYPEAAPGHGVGIFEVKGTKIAVINLQGRIFMEPIDCPFLSADKAIASITDTNIIIVDFHAEATSEKTALAWYLDGKVSAVLGTHTHVQTSDFEVFPEGTGYISDVGMTGSKNGVIGVVKEEILHKFISGMPFRYKVADGNVSIEAVIIDVDNKTGKCNEIRALRIKCED